jgi:hypothetical protein
MFRFLAVIARYEENGMAKYSKGASKDVESAMRRRKKGTLKSGKGGKGGTVKSRKQAIAIGLSEARKKGKKVPRQSSKRKGKGRKKS